MCHGGRWAISDLLDQSQYVFARDVRHGTTGPAPDQLLSDVAFDRLGRALILTWRSRYSSATAANVFSCLRSSARSARSNSAFGSFPRFSKSSHLRASMRA